MQETGQILRENLQKLFTSWPKVRGKFKEILGKL